ncbi:hypothetical protein RJ640_000272 [Escallonia rubra]|uniref:Uncharacterized protein n=1 Tax=Escallonia rubra TaxID=112253 RepID=A0AA88RZ25_9ASTE|nr:hypothetical protein RJ640_000272 [Escallonia rubra]
MEDNWVAVTQALCQGQWPIHEGHYVPFTGLVPKKGLENGIKQWSDRPHVPFPKTRSVVVRSLILASPYLKGRWKKVEDSPPLYLALLSLLFSLTCLLHTIVKDL